MVVVLFTLQPFGRHGRRNEGDLDLGLSRSQPELLDQSGTADDVGLLIAVKGSESLSEKASADDDGEALALGVDDQWEGGPGLPKGRGEGHAADIRLETGGRQGSGDALKRLFARVSRKRAGDTRRIRLQASLSGKEANQTDFP
jgi:hypothetical protein